MKKVFHPVHTEEAIGTLCALARDIWHETYDPIIGPDQVTYMLERFQSPGAVRKQIADGWAYWLYESLTRPAGYLAIEPLREDGTCFVSKCYTAVESRQQGWARAALNHLCREIHPTRIKLVVNKANLNAIETYRKLGFKDIGPRVTDIGNGYIMDDRVMERRLRPKQQ